MFEVVVAGRRTQRVWHRPDVVVGSVAVHALMAAALVNLSTRMAPPIDLEQEMATFLEVLTRVPDLPSLPAGAGGMGGGAAALPSEPAAVPASSSVALSNVSLELPDLAATLPSASELGPVDASAFGEFEGTRGLGRADAPLDDDVLLEQGSTAGPVVSEAALAEKPRVLNRFEMQEQWQRLYPPVLNAKGIAGETVVTFVIDTQGRVEPQTIRMISSSHPEFIVATITGVKRLRFAPARLNGSPVRVRAVMPVHWRPMEG